MADRMRVTPLMGSVPCWQGVDVRQYTSRRHLPPEPGQQRQVAAIVFQPPAKLHARQERQVLAIQLEELSERGNLARASEHKQVLRVRDRAIGREHGYPSIQARRAARYRRRFSFFVIAACVPRTLSTRCIPVLAASGSAKNAAFASTGMYPGLST